MGAATLLSAAMLLAPGCERRPEPNEAAEAGAPVRQASFRSIAARAFLATCPGGSERAETRRQLERLDELKRLAARKGAGYALWLGENDWAALSRHSDREPCRAGEEAYGRALAAFSTTLDELARRIAEYRE